MQRDHVHNRSSKSKKLSNDAMDSIAAVVLIAIIVMGVSYWLYHI